MKAGAKGGPRALFGFLGKWGSRVALERVFMSPDTSPEAAFCIEEVMKATDVIVNTYALHGYESKRRGGRGTTRCVLCAVCGVRCAVCVLCGTAMC